MNKKVARHKYQSAISNEYIISENKWHYKCECGKNDFKTKRRLIKRKLNGTCIICGQKTIDFEFRI